MGYSSRTQISGHQIFEMLCFPSPPIQGKKGKSKVLQQVQDMGAALLSAPFADVIYKVSTSGYPASFNNL